MDASSQHSTQELVETVRVALDYFEPGDRYADQHEYIVNAHAALSCLEEQLETLEREKHELIGVAGGVLWIDNNMHLYGTKEWRGYFKAVVRDARRGYELRAVSSPAKRPT